MSRKARKSDESVYQMLESERARCQAVLEKVARELATLPKGSLCQRRVLSNGKLYLYPCLKYRDGTGVKVVHIPRENAAEVQSQLERKKRLKAVVKETELRLATLRDILAQAPRPSDKKGK